MFSSLAASVWLATSSPVAIELPQHSMLAQVVAAQQAAQLVAPEEGVDEVISAEVTPVDGPTDLAPPEEGEVIEEEGANTEAPDAQAPGTQATATGGDAIVVTGSSEVIGRDPLVELNEASFAITQEVDQALVAPIANAYEDRLPRPIRKGLRNFFRNLLEPVNFINYLLQFKPGKAFETLGRFAINSTVGIGGLIDVAERKPFNLPYRRNGFSNTLGYYGVGHGPFLFIPLVGATTLRDLVGSFLDQSVVPLALGKPFNTPYYAIPAYTVNSLEFRIEFDEKLGQIRESDDPYFAARESYLCNREADIAALKNRPPPRDCSIEALMAEGAPLVGVGADLTPADLAAATDANTPALDTETEAEQTPEPVQPVVPQIIYISEEVVQPLPQS
ncbi:MAG: VacJ family lipoprotein [Erythrobacter sp.]